MCMYQLYMDFTVNQCIRNLYNTISGAMEVSNLDEPILCTKFATHRFIKKQFSRMTFNVRLPC